MEIQAHQFDACISKEDWVTQFAAVSRAKTKSNNPSVRFKALLKEAVGKQPSRPLELYPVMINIEDITTDQLKTIAKFGYLEYGIFHTNLRAVIKAGIDKNLYRPSTKPFFVFTLTISKKLWANLITRPIATMISSSARMVSLKNHNICEDDAMFIIAGYNNTLNAQVDAFIELSDLMVRNGWKEDYVGSVRYIVDYIVDNAELESVCEDIPDFYNPLMYGRHMNKNYVFTCFKNNNGIDFVYEPQTTFVSEPFNYEGFINYNEFREYYNLKYKTDTSKSECYKIVTTMPLFVLYHIFTHTELHIDAEILDVLWFPEDINEKDRDTLESLIQEEEYDKVRNMLKELGYKKEVYQRYPDFAQMATVTIIGRKDNVLGFKHLFEERNVLNSTRENWTQKETTEFLKESFDLLNDRITLQ